jgi:hypothetical protein
MKLLVILVISTLKFSCSDNKKSAEKPISPGLRTSIQTDTVICNEQNSDSLADFVKTFKASSIDLSNSISRELASFLQRVDSNCLRRDTMYRVFITGILAKLYLYHLDCCSQAYDLQSMESPPAKVIVNEYRRLLGYLPGQGIEFLNSGKVEDYILNDSILSKNSILKPILKQIEIKSK